MFKFNTDKFNQLSNEQAKSMEQLVTSVLTPTITPGLPPEKVKQLLFLLSAIQQRNRVESRIYDAEKTNSVAITRDSKYCIYKAEVEGITRVFVDVDELLENEKLNLSTQQEQCIQSAPKTLLLFDGDLHTGISYALARRVMSTGRHKAMRIQSGIPAPVNEA